MGMKIMLFDASVAAMMEDEEHLAEMCEFAVAVNEEHEISRGSRRTVTHADSLSSTMLDNYVLAVAAFRAGVHGRHPLVVLAALNKVGAPRHWQRHRLRDADAAVSSMGGPRRLYARPGVENDCRLLYGELTLAEATLRAPLCVFLMAPPTRRQRTSHQGFYTFARP